MKIKAVVAAVFLSVLTTMTVLAGSASTVSTKDWEQDIDILVKKVVQYHPKPWARISKEAFMLQIENIKANLQKWSEDRIILEIAKLVASLRDGHTDIILSNQEISNSWFPVRIEKFFDGLFITAADKAHADILGAKVLRMGKLDAESAFARIGTVVASDSDLSIGRLATNYLSNAAILQGLGIIDSQRLLPLEAILPNGQSKTIQLESAKWRMRRNWAWNQTAIPSDHETRTIFDDKKDELPLYLSKIIPARIPYWFELVPNDRLLYFQLNQVANWRKEPFADFTKRLFKAYDDHAAEVDKFVVDLRFNEGGNGYLLGPFVREFVLRGDSFAGKKIYIITGTHTFSAATNLIGRMLKDTAAITVGDIAPGPLNWCSDTIMFSLPNSGLLVDISTMFWQEGHATDDRGYYPPDCYSPATFSDYAACHDAVLEAITKNEVKSLKEILFNEGKDKFFEEYRKREQRFGPAQGWFPYIPFDLITYVYYTLMPAGKTDEVSAVFKLMATLYPEDLRTWYLAAEHYENKGDFKEALENYKKLLDLEPDIPEARQPYQNLLLATTFNDQGLDGVAGLFKNLRKSHPNDTDEGTLNNLGYWFVRNNRVQDAISIFKLNVELYPDYANGYDSLGEAYATIGEKERAIESYEKALQLDPGLSSAKEALEKLKK